MSAQLMNLNNILIDNAVLLKYRKWPITLLVLALGAGCTPLPTTAPAGRVDEHAAVLPKLDVNFPDPFILPVADGLAAYATNGHGLHIQMSHSSDGVSWSAPREAMPTLPAWVMHDHPSIWAPEAIRIGERYVLYFSARHPTRTRPSKHPWPDGNMLCIGAAVADAPDGPFIPQPEPLTCGGEHGVIDASPFRDDDGNLWLHVKTDGNCCGIATRVQALTLSTNGLAVVGEPVTLAGVINDQPWEGAVVEAPHMVKHEGRYLLFYAGNDYASADYAVGYTHCEGPTGPCQDAPENPIMHSGFAPGLIGPGHPAVFRHAGRMWMAWHGWRTTDNGDGRYRAMYTAPLEWNEGRPVVARRHE